MIGRNGDEGRRMTKGWGTDRMKKKMKLLAAGLALSLLMTQTVYAEVLISPLDPSNAAGSTAQIVNEAAGANGVQNGSGPQATNGAQNVNGPQAADGTQNGNIAQTAKAPQMKTDPETGVLVSSASYSTKEAAVPEISAEAAILYDVTNDQVVFEKNADEKLYPASITKLMTAMLVLEKANLNDMVTFSKTAVTNLESGAVTLKLAEGDKVSVKDCLYGLLVKSANEVANGLAEHVGGSISGFADMMNARAKELGCTNTHFVNPNGLNDPNHYTTCRDMAKIAKAAFSNPALCEIASTLSYEFPATKNAAARTITPGHKMLYPTDSRYYEGIVGGKTGYTSLAGNTLVTCVEKDGVRMVAVILKAKSSHYADTKALLDYGYAKRSAGTGNKWIQDGDVWRFEISGGIRVSNCLVTIDGKDYGFDAEGKMLTGWNRHGNSWYGFDENGALVKNNWMKDGEKWFYLGKDGTIVKNAWIDNTYYVGADGAWDTSVTKQ